jgi:hypothetical protein
VLHEDVGDPGVGGKGSEELPERVEAARGSADADDGEQRARLLGTLSGVQLGGPERRGTECAAVTGR